MKILVLGGTRFVGRHLVAAARARVHELTLFHRGNHPEVFPDVEQLVGDRDGVMEALRGRSWDAVIDSSGYLPRLVRASAELLSGQARHYTFISSISVYADSSQRGLSEDDQLAALDDATTEEVTGATYGGLKALCEAVVRQTFAGTTLVVRPGLIVGPHDPTDRFTYWPVRVAAGGEVLAPVGPQLPIQFIDARDLAAWTLTMIEAGEGGTYNAVTPGEQFHLGELLEVSRRVSGSSARFTWVDERFLLERAVRPFIELPLWLPGEDINFSTVSSDRAQAKGLAFRPLEQTVADILEWSRSRDEDPQPKAGMSRDRERELLEAWHAQA